MIFLSSVAATLVFFDHSGDIIHINISTSVGVEPTNAARAHWDIIKIRSTPTEVNWIRLLKSNMCMCVYSTWCHGLVYASECGNFWSFSHK